LQANSFDNSDHSGGISHERHSVVILVRHL
jgi:hypothetical protein